MTHYDLIRLKLPDIHHDTAKQLAELIRVNKTPTVLIATQMQYGGYDITLPDGSITGASSSAHVKAIAWELSMELNTLVNIEWTTDTYVPE